MLPRMIAAAIAPLTAAGVLAPAAAVLAVYDRIPALTAQVRWVTFVGVAISYVVTLIATLTVIPMLHTRGHVRLAHYTAAGATIGVAVPALIGGVASANFRDVAITALFGFLSGAAVASTFWMIERHVARRPK